MLQKIRDRPCRASILAEQNCRNALRNLRFRIQVGIQFARVIMHVDKARREYQAVRIDHLLTSARLQISDLLNCFARDSHIALFQSLISIYASGNGCALDQYRLLLRESETRQVKRAAPQ